MRDGQGVRDELEKSSAELSRIESEMSRTEDSMSAAQDLNSRASREISALEADQRSLTSEISALRADIEKANGAKIAALQAKEDAISKAIQFGVSAQTTSKTSPSFLPTFFL